MSGEPTQVGTDDSVIRHEFISIYQQQQLALTSTRSLKKQTSLKAVRYFATLLGFWWIGIIWTYTSKLKPIFENVCTWCK